MGITRVQHARQVHVAQDFVEGLGHGIRNNRLSANINREDAPLADNVPDEVVSHVDVLAPVVVDLVRGQVASAPISAPWARCLGTSRRGS